MAFIILWTKTCLSGRTPEALSHGLGSKWTDPAEMLRIITEDLEEKLKTIDIPLSNYIIRIIAVGPWTLFGAAAGPDERLLFFMMEKNES